MNVHTHHSVSIDLILCRKEHVIVGISRDLAVLNYVEMGIVGTEAFFIDHHYIYRPVW